MKMIKTVMMSLIMLSAVSLYSTFTYAGQVSINTADAPTLAAELTGVGEKKAQAIVDYRKLNGAFSTISDLQKVKGISARTIEKNKQNLTL